MTAWQRIPLVCTSFVLAAFATGTHAAEKINLDRVTPVPATEPIPIQDFFRPLLLQQPKLNPSGTEIAALISGNVDKHRLLTYEIKTQKYDTLEGIGDKDIYRVDWLNDQRLIYFLSKEKQYGLGLFVADFGRLRDSCPLLQYYGARLISIPPGDRTHPLVWMSYDSLETEKDLGVGAINTDLRTGQFLDLNSATAGWSDVMDARESNARHVAKRYPILHEGMCVGYMADKEGQLAFAFAEENGLWFLYRLAGDQWVKCPVDLEAIDIVDCGNKPGQLIVRNWVQKDQPCNLQFMDAATGQFGEVLIQDKAYDFQGSVYRDPMSHDVVGIQYPRNGPAIVWFNDGYRQLQKVLDGFFPGLVVRIIGSDDAGKIFLVSTFSDRQPAIYSLVDLEKRSAGLFKNSAPWIDPKRMQPMNVVKYKTKDGRHLDAYLTLPAGASKQNPPPLVVLPHGGPWVRDEWGFDGKVQFLASRGYAVLQPNYRGSTGYNWMFPEEDRYEFLKMHEDVTAATKAAITSGLVDGSRVAIMGGSFGGYLALSGVAHEPSLYRCAVTIAGVFDWRQMMKQEKYYQFDEPYYARLLRKLGDPKRDAAKFDAISPVRYVDQIHVPVFVSHGKDDPVSDIEQSKQLVSELEKHHVPHEVFFVGGEGHGMAHLDNQVELYSRIEAFLAKNLAPVKNVAVAATEAPKN